MVIICKSCSTQNPDNAKFCGKCGIKLSKNLNISNPSINLIQETPIIKHSKNYNLLFILLILLFLVLLFPYKIVTEIKSTPYTDYELYTEKTPYQGYETYYENQLTEKEICEIREPKYNLIENNYFNDANQLSMNCEIENYENKPIKLTIDYQIKDNVDKFMGSNYANVLLDQTLNSKASKTFSKAFSYSISDVKEFNCIVYSKEDTFCENKIVSENISTQRLATLYNEISKSRKITNYKDVEIRKQVHLIFNIHLPWHKTYS